MKSEYKKILLSHTRISNNAIFDSKEYKEYIKNKSKTINLYKNELSLFLYDKIIKDSANSDIINYEMIGRLFFLLVLYTNDPDIDIEKELKTKKEKELYNELKNIYNNTMLAYFENSKTNATNAKKRYNKTDKKTNTKKPLDGATT